jgi:CPA2 family monovalent cation:H+ antiporter-2
VTAYVMLMAVTGPIATRFAEPALRRMSGQPEAEPIS